MGNKPKVVLSLYHNKTKMKPSINYINLNSRQHICFMAKIDYWVYPGNYMHS